jgi:hypothetical protein
MKIHRLLLFALASACVYGALASCRLLRMGGVGLMTAGGAAGGAAVGGVGGAAVGGVGGYALSEAMLPQSKQPSAQSAVCDPGQPPHQTKRGPLGGVKSAWYVVSYQATRWAIWIVLAWLAVGLVFGRFREHLLGLLGSLLRFRPMAFLRRLGALVGYVHTERVSRR